MHILNYKDTINLPKTDFKMKANLKSLEPTILEKWEDIDVANYLMEIERMPKNIYCMMDHLMQMVIYI